MNHCFIPNPAVKFVNTIGHRLSSPLTETMVRNGSTRAGRSTSRERPLTAQLAPCGASALLLKKRFDLAHGRGAFGGRWLDEIGRRPHALVGDIGRLLQSIAETAIYTVSVPTECFLQMAASCPTTTARRPQSR